MNKETLKRIFEFLEEKENKTPKDKGNLRWKLTFNEPLTEKDLNIKGDLDLSETPITSLPEGLKVGGQLWLIGCDNLTSLPKGLEVGEDLHLSSDFLLRSHSDDELREMIKPGFIKGEIFR